MNTEEKKEILELLNESKSPLIDKNITEWLFRALIALLLFLGNNIRLEQQKQGDNLQQVKQNVSEIKTKNEYYSKDIEAFKQALSQPRFTKEDFDLGISPLVKQLNANTHELNVRNGFMSETEKRLAKIEYQIIELIEFKKN